MQILIVYDISSTQRRNQVFEKLKEYGINTQRSAFECEIDSMIFTRLTYSLKSIIDVKEDKLLIQPLCKNCIRHTEVSGNTLMVYDFAHKVI